MLAEKVNLILGLLVILAQIEVAFILLLGLRVPRWFRKNSLIFAFVVSLLATSGSLFYSEVAGYEPCKLCWYQRILMYPLVLILGLGIRFKDKASVRYGLGLAVPGFLLASYHYLMQIEILPSLACSAVGYSVSCSQRFVMQFGYITIPLMSATAFGLIILLLNLAKKTK